MDSNHHNLPGRGDPIECGPGASLWPTAFPDPGSTLRIHGEARITRPLPPASNAMVATHSAPPLAWSAKGRPRCHVATVQVEALNAGVGPVGDVQRLAVSREAVGDLKWAGAGSFAAP